MEQLRKKQLLVYLSLLLKAKLYNLAFTSIFLIVVFSFYYHLVYIF